MRLTSFIKPMIYIVIYMKLSTTISLVQKLQEVTYADRRAL
ncbi:UNVERIFIED_ORG: hypothetical protein OKW14_002491 [Pantoea brenneri]|nr:hypothetical protein [Pantoea brenneri]